MKMSHSGFCSRLDSHELVTGLPLTAKTRNDAGCRPAIKTAKLD
jgi:hypothetical protein